MKVPERDFGAIVSCDHAYAGETAVRMLDLSVALEHTCHSAFDMTLVLDVLGPEILILLSTFLP